MPLDNPPATAGATMLPVASIKADPNNVRRKLGDTAGLVASIRQLGILQPITVSEDLPSGQDHTTYTVVMGHRRLAAAFEAGLDQVPCIITGDGENAVRQAAENMVRLPMSAIEQWRAVERLRAGGMNDEAARMALGLEARLFRRLQLLGQLHPAILDHIEATGDMPEERILPIIANATTGDQAQAWEKGKPGAKGRKGTKEADWWNIRHALAKTHILQSIALFGEDLAKKHKVVWTEDFFAPPEEAIRTTDLTGFRKAQREWLEKVAIPDLKKAGVTACMVALDQYGRPEIPKGCESGSYLPHTHKPWEVGKTDKAWIRGLYLRDDGSVSGVYYRAKEKAPAAAKPKAAGPAPLVTGKGEQLIETAQRAAAAERLRQQDDPWNLLAVAILCLDAHTGWRDKPDVTGMLDTRGALNLVDERGPIAAAARELLGFILTEAQDKVSLDRVQRIGAGLLAVPTLPASAEVLATMKKGALTYLSRFAEVGDHKTQAAAKLAIAKALGTTPIPPEHLPPLAYKPVPPKPARPSKPGRHDDDPSDDEPDEDGSLGDEDDAKTHDDEGDEG